MEYDEDFSIAKESQYVKDKLDEISNWQDTANAENHSLHSNLAMKLGELCFLAGSAITPVIIVIGGDGKVRHVGWAIAGVLVYLFTGLLVFFCIKYFSLQRSHKRAIDLDGPKKQCKSLLGTLSDLKAKPDPGLQAEYLEDKKAISSVDVPKEKLLLDPTISFGFSGFITATILVTRTVWTLDDRGYYAMLTCVVLALFVYVIENFYFGVKRWEKAYGGKVKKKAAKIYKIIDSVHGNLESAYVKIINFTRRLRRMPVE